MFEEGLTTLVGENRVERSYHALEERSKYTVVPVFCVDTLLGVGGLQGYVRGTAPTSPWQAGLSGRPPETARACRDGHQSTSSAVGIGSTREGLPLLTFLTFVVFANVSFLPRERAPRELLHIRTRCRHRQYR